MERFFSLSNETAQGNYFAKLSDEGTFTISAGTPSAPGKQIFSNNVNDPVESVDIESITYDFDHVRASPPDNITGVIQNCVNNTPTEFTCSLSLALNYTKTNTFTFTANQSIQLGYKVSAKVAVPGIAEGSTEWSVTGTIGFMEGRSDAETEARTFTSGASIPIPARTTYKAGVVGQSVDATIPFTYTGTGTYNSGRLRASLTLRENTTASTLASLQSRYPAFKRRADARPELWKRCQQWQRNSADQELSPHRRAA